MDTALGRVNGYGTAYVHTKVRLKGFRKEGIIIRSSGHWSPCVRGGILIAGHSLMTAIMIPGIIFRTRQRQKNGYAGFKNLVWRILHRSRNDKQDILSETPLVVPVVFFCFIDQSPEYPRIKESENRREFWKKWRKTPTNRPTDQQEGIFFNTYII